MSQNSALPSTSAASSSRMNSLRFGGVATAMAARSPGRSFRLAGGFGTRGITMSDVPPGRVTAPAQTMAVATAIIRMRRCVFPRVAGNFTMGVLFLFQACRNSTYSPRYPVTHGAHLNPLTACGEVERLRQPGLIWVRRAKLIGRDAAPPRCAERVHRAAQRGQADSCRI